MKTMQSRSKNNSKIPELNLSNKWWILFVIWLISTVFLYSPRSMNDVGSILLLYATMLFVLPIGWLLIISKILIKKLRNHSIRISKNTFLLFIAFSISLLVEIGLVTRYYINEKNHTVTEEYLNYKKKAIDEFGELLTISNNAFTLYTDRYVNYPSPEYRATYKPTSSQFYEGQKYTGNIDVRIYYPENELYKCSVNNRSEYCTSIGGGVEKYVTQISSQISYYYLLDGKVYEIVLENLKPELPESEIFDIFASIQK
ncbi:hypothetical protein KC960_01585 [Candidatus Saccharibacteria bacterium]|nr:hypothetical protein [Candidatus Saccharibacteria bacterium]